MGLINYFPGINCVKLTEPEHPLQFRNKSDDIFWDLPSLIKKYCPEFINGAKNMLHPLLFNGHLQTINAGINTFKNVDQVWYKRLIINYPDGGQGALDFAVDSETQNSSYLPKEQLKPLFERYSYFSLEEIKNLTSDDDKPLLIVLPGLTGGSYESYVRSLVNNITTNYSFKACVLNSRGCCQSTITTPTLYNGFWTDDIRYCIKELRSMFPKRKFYLVGFSLGASVAVNYLGQESECSDITCAAVLGNPWDLADSSRHLMGSLMGKYIYSPSMAKNLVNLLKDNLTLLQKDPFMKHIYETKMNEIDSVENFDNWVVAKMFGFNTSFEYYRIGSSVNRLLQVRTPLLAINALDDPIVGVKSLPYREIRANPYTALVETTKGGHIGWFNRKGERWYVEPLCNFFYSFHSEIVKKNLTPDLNSVILPRNNKFVKDRMIDPFNRS